MRIFIFCIGVLSTPFLFSEPESFIVKKTKQIVLPYEDQWSDLFAQLLQLFADLDAEKSAIQKMGIQSIVHCVHTGDEIPIAGLSSVKKKEAVQELKQLVDQLQRTVRMCSAYKKELQTLFAPPAKSKK